MSDSEFVTPASHCLPGVVPLARPPFGQPPPPQRPAKSEEQVRAELKECFWDLLREKKVRQCRYTAAARLLQKSMFGRSSSFQRISIQ